jgi:hypothetical protein
MRRVWVIAVVCSVELVVVAVAGGAGLTLLVGSPAMLLTVSGLLAVSGMAIYRLVRSLRGTPG